MGVRVLEIIRWASDNWSCILYGASRLAASALTFVYGGGRGVGKQKKKHCHTCGMSFLRLIGAPHVLSDCFFSCFSWGDGASVWMRGAFASFAKRRTKVVLCFPESRFSCFSRQRRKDRIPEGSVR